MTPYENTEISAPQATENPPVTQEVERLMQHECLRSIHSTRPSSLQKGHCSSTVLRPRMNRRLSKTLEEMRECSNSEANRQMSLSLLECASEVGLDNWPRTHQQCEYHRKRRHFFSWLIWSCKQANEHVSSMLIRYRQPTAITSSTSVISFTRIPIPSDIEGVMGTPRQSRKQPPGAPAALAQNHQAHPSAAVSHVLGLPWGCDRSESLCSNCISWQSQRSVSAEQ